MRSLTNVLFFLAALGPKACSSHPTDQNHVNKRSGPICSDVVIPVTVSAENNNIPEQLVSSLITALTDADTAAVENLINSIGDTLESILAYGTFDIAGRYCEPEVTVEDRINTIQLLVHGVTYDKNYWSGGDFPEGYDGDKYSWIAYASKLGYPTLSIDRLGSGNSSHPDPVTVVQVPTQIVAYHEVIQALRSGVVGDRKFSKVAYVGHSYGSIMGNSIAARYPDDADVFVLTGYSKFVKQSAVGVSITPRTIPAFLVDERFSNLPAAYQAESYEDGRISLFFTDDESEYDPKIAHIDFERQGTVTLGEAISSLSVNDVAENYTKPVHVITGHKDQIFCGVAAPLLGESNCGSGSDNYMAQTASLFPNAQYSYTDIPGTGHGLNFHYSANITFKDAHDFLDKAGF